MTISITSGGRERVAETSELLAQAFADDPVIAYLLCSMSREERLSYLPTYFKGLVTAATMNHSIVDEAGGWKSCGVLMPPGSRVDNPWTLIPAGFIPMLWKVGLGGCQRMLGEYQTLGDGLKAKALKGQKKYYYVFFVGTLAEARGKGLCSAIMRSFQEMAARDQLPIWLEATTEKSMNLYQNLGWEVVGEGLLGEGKANADGIRCKGGEGVKIWGMIWRPAKV